MDQQHSLQASGLGASYGPRVILAEVDFVLPPPASLHCWGLQVPANPLCCTLAGLNDANPRFRSWGQVLSGGQPLNGDNRPRLVQQHARLMRANTLDALIEMARQVEQRSRCSGASG